MDTIFMNSENSKTSKPHVLTLKLTSKLDLRIGEKVIALSNLSIYYTWRSIKSLYNNKFKMMNLTMITWNDEFELPYGSYSLSDIQDYFEFILEKHGKDIDELSVQIYVNKIENRITFKTKNGYITEDKIGENASHLEITEVVLVHCNIVSNDYQQDSRVLYTFVPNKSFGSWLEISPENHIFLKMFNSEFQNIKLWFTYQNSKPLEIEDRINLTMVIKWRV